MAQEQETDQDIGELESRLERLRVLYEQYFMGLEKREPGVQHKDVERRIQQLRKSRFQSTAARFKFQTMVQRFNTLQQYWTRTCREIENGTYKRHLQRAARRLATVPPPDAVSDEKLADAAQREKAREKATADLGALLSEDIDLDAEVAGALAALEKPKTAPKTTLGALGQNKDGPRAHTSPILHLGKAIPIKSLTPEAKPSISPRLSTSPKPAGLAPLNRRPTTGSSLFALGKADAPAAVPAQRPAPAQTTPATEAKPAPSPAPTPTRAVPVSPQAAPTPAKAAPTPAKAAPTPAKAAPTPAKAAPTPVQAAPPPRPAPAPAKEAPPQRVAPPPRAAAPLAPSMRPQEKRQEHDTGLSGERIKALHDSYVEARKKTNASPVSYEKLEKNIRDTEQKLRAQHQGRKIDFEVDIKDGKAILKPRLK